MVFILGFVLFFFLLPGIPLADSFQPVVEDEDNGSALRKTKLFSRSGTGTKWDFTTAIRGIFKC